MKQECEKKLNRNKIGIIVSLLVPVFDIIVGVLFEKLNMGDGALAAWIGAAVIAYLIGGGLTSALKMFWRVTMISWFIIPIFPIDLFVGGVGFCLAGSIALFLPIVFVLLTRYQISKDKKAAEEYLVCCKPKAA